MEITLDHVRFLGRTAERDGITYLGNTGSGFEFITTAKKITATLTGYEPQCASENTAAFLGIYLNEGEDPFRIIQLDKPEGEYTIYVGNGEKTTVRVFKLTEASMTFVGIRSLEADGDIQPTPERGRKIEFIGDSYTCGYGNMTDRPEEGFKTHQENGFLAYSSLTARMLYADFSIVATSGIGLLSSWTGTDKINDGFLMDRVYPYENVYVDQMLGLEPKEWDFRRFVPDLITVFLGTNDNSYIIYDEEKRIPLFGEKYRAFLRTVSEKNPTSRILCLMGVMTEPNSRIFKEIRSAVEDLAKDGVPITAHCLQKTDFSMDGAGGSWHPTYRSHRKMAAELAQVIRTVLK